MDSPVTGIQGKKRRIDSRRAFVVAIAITVVITAIIIALGSSGCGDSSPSPSVVASPSPSPTIVASPSPSPVIFTWGTTKGSPDAPLTLFEYSDFQCSHCQEFALTTQKQLEEAYIATGKVRLVFKHYVVNGNESMNAALASECAAEQNRFWPYYDLLMQIQASPSEEDLTVAKLESLAQELDLDMESFCTCLESEKYKEKVNGDKEEAQALGISGTPAFIIDGGLATGNPPFETFQEVIERLLEESSD